MARQAAPYALAQLFRDGATDQDKSNDSEKAIRNARPIYSGLPEAEDVDGQVDTTKLVLSHGEYLKKAGDDIAALKQLVQNAKNSLDIQQRLKDLQTATGAHQTVQEITNLIIEQPPTVKLLLQGAVNDESSVVQVEREQELAQLNSRITTAERQSHRYGQDFISFKEQSRQEIARLRGANKGLENKITELRVSEGKWKGQYDLLSGLRHGTPEAQIIPSIETAEPKEAQVPSIDVQEAQVSVVADMFEKYIVAPDIPAVLEELKTSINAVGITLSDRSTGERLAEQEKQRLRSEVAKVEGNMEFWKTAVDDAQIQIAKERLKNKDLQEKYDEAKTEAEAQNKENGELLKKLELAVTKGVEWKALCKAAQNELVEKETSLDDNENLQKDGHIAALEEAIKSKDTTIMSLNNRLANTEEELEETDESKENFLEFAVIASRKVLQLAPKLRKAKDEVKGLRAEQAADSEEQAETIERKDAEILSLETALGEEYDSKQHYLEMARDVGKVAVQLDKKLRDAKTKQVTSSEEIAKITGLLDETEAVISKMVTPETAQEMETQIAELQTDLDELQATYALQIKANTRLEERLKANSKTILGQTSTITNQQTKIDSQVDQILELTTAKTSAEAQRDSRSEQFHSANKSTQERKTKHEKAVENAKQDLKILRDEHTKAMGDKDTQHRKDVAAERDRIEDERKKADKDREVAGKEKQKLGEEKVALVKDVSSANAQVSVLRSSETNLQDKLKAVNGEVEKLKQEQGELQVQYAQAGSDAKTARETFEREKHSLNERITELNTTVASKSDQIEGNDRQLLDKTKTIQELTAKSTELDSRTAEVGELSTKNNNLESQLKDKTNAEASAVKDLERVRGELEQSRSNAQELQGQIDAAKDAQIIAADAKAEIAQRHAQEREDSRKGGAVEQEKTQDKHREEIEARHEKEVKTASLHARQLAQQEIDNLKSQLINQKQLLKTEEDNRQLAVEQALQMGREDADATLESLRTEMQCKIDEAKASANTQKGIGNKLSDEKFDIQTKLGNVEKDLTTVRQDLRSSALTIQHRSARITQLEGEKGTLETQKAKADASLTAAMSQVSKWRRLVLPSAPDFDLDEMSAVITDKINIGSTAFKNRANAWLKELSHADAVGIKVAVRPFAIATFITAVLSPDELNHAAIVTFVKACPEKGDEFKSLAYLQAALVHLASQTITFSEEASLFILRTFELLGMEFDDRRPALNEIYAALKPRLDLTSLLHQALVKRIESILSGDAAIPLARAVFDIHHGEVIDLRPNTRAIRVGEQLFVLELGPVLNSVHNLEILPMSNLMCDILSSEEADLFVQGYPAEGNELKKREKVGARAELLVKIAVHFKGARVVRH